MVEVFNPATANVVAVVVVFKTPFWYTLYPVTPTLSVAAVQAKLVLEVVVPEAESMEVVGVVVSEPDPVMVKFTLLTSKKIWLVPFTMILLVVPGLFGITTLAVPVFGFAESKVIGNVCPPSVDNKISTFAQFTKFTFVPATVQFIVCDDPAA